MKPYFSKLLTEQERAGSRNLSRKWGGRVRVHPDPDHDYEDEINFVSMARRGRQYGYNHKEFTDVLNPLYGFLEKNVGRPWDMVYSEICKGLDRRSITGLHVFTHLWDYVDRDTVMCEDGKVRAFSYIGSLREPDDFYVHPYTGILCAHPERCWTWGARYRRSKKEPDVTYHTIWVSMDGKGGCEYRRIDGLWFEVEWSLHADAPEFVSPWKPNRERGGLTKKRQLGKKELKHLGLKNIMA